MPASAKSSGRAADAGARNHSQAFCERAATEGIARVSLPACDQRTANLAIALRDGGAEVVLVRVQPLSTQDESGRVAESRLQHSTYAIKGEDNQTTTRTSARRLEHKPQFTMDDGADLVDHAAHQAHRPGSERDRRHGRDNYGP